MANCDTTLFINSYKMDQNKTGLAFVDIFFYLLEKHWKFTISNIGKITHSKTFFISFGRYNLIYRKSRIIPL